MMLNSKKVRIRQVLVLSLSLLLISGCGVNWKVNIQILRLQSKSMDLRCHAAIVLARIGPEAKAAVPALIQALKNADSEVFGSVAMALGEIGPEARAAVPVLIQALREGNSQISKTFYPTVHRNAADSLVQIG